MRDGLYAIAGSHGVSIVCIRLSRSIISSSSSRLTRSKQLPVHVDLFLRHESFRRPKPAWIFPAGDHWHGLLSRLCALWTSREGGSHHSAPSHT